jgi:hypothetical protein
MGAMFHVFLDGAKDTSPAGLQKLAEAIAARYGLKAPDLITRLQAGRFRVKANVDRATADTFARDLDRLGARCTVEAANAANSRPTPLPFAAAKPAERPSKPSLPPSALPPAQKPSTTTPPAGQFSSGLSAAFSAKTSEADLGALSKLESGALSLASVDGSEGAGGAPAGNFAPPDLDVPASIGPAPAKKPEKQADKKPARPKDEPLDLFVPPEAQGEAFQVELADDAPDHMRKRASTPPANKTVDAPPDAPVVRISSPELRRSQPLPAVAPEAAVAPARRRGNPLADERVRFVAGVVLAILIGFLPAHLIAKAREKSAFADVDHKVEMAQASVDTAEAYDALDSRRAELLDEKYSDRQSIAIVAMLIWAACGGGIAFLWFRKVPWDRVAA